MSTPPWASRAAKSPDLVIPLYASIGITERREEIDHTEIDRSLNGSAVVLHPLYGTIYRVYLEGSGPAMRWAPAFAALSKRVPFRLASTLHLEWPIAAGQQQALLPRDPVPGSVRAFYADDPEETRLGLTVAGRLVTLDAPAARAVVIPFLPFYDLILSERRTSAAEIAGDKQWSMVAEEVSP